MADYKVGDLANLIHSSSQSNKTPTDDLFAKKKNKKRTAQDEPEIDIDTVQKQQKKKKHKENKEIEKRDNEPGVSNTQEPQKKKHKENTETEVKNDHEPLTIKTGKKRIRKKKKKSGATETLETVGAVAEPVENSTDKPEENSLSVSNEVKVTKKVISSQKLEMIKNKKKLKKQKRKLKKKAENKKLKINSENIEPTVTLENKENKKEKSKKETKQERIKERKNQSLPTRHPDAEARTIFIGNVNMQTKRKELSRVFSKYGKIEAVRIRGVAVGEQGMLKKVAHVTGQMHPSRSSVTAYVRFESTDSVAAAMEANGMILRDNHLNVDKAVNETKRELRNSVFVGNLPWEAEDEQLYQHFKACGEIDSVRVIRDKQLGSGKGFGYVNFKNSDATEVALQLNGKLFMNRPLRVIRCTKKQKKEKIKEDNITKKSNMKLDFMKRNNKQKLKNNQQTKGKDSKESEFSGAKTAEFGKNKKFKKPRWNKADSKRVAVASLLTGDKAVVQRPKFTAKKGGGKLNSKPIAKKFGGKSGGKFGGKPGGKPGRKSFTEKSGPGRKEIGGTGQNKRITFD